MTFDLFDPEQEVVIEYGTLPHWYQPGISYFVTFRTGDSIPTAVMDDWQQRRRAWLQQRGLSVEVDPELLPPSQRREYHRLFSTEFLAYLDRGHGECVLKRPELAAIVMQSLLFFDGDRYLVSDAVVMPNHVHALVCLKGTTPIRAQCRSWKHFTATKINAHLGRHGEFWQSDSFDHAVRTPEAFTYFRGYIAQNPRKAGLSEGEYLLYRFDQK